MPTIGANVITAANSQSAVEPAVYVDGVGVSPVVIDMDGGVNRRSIRIVRCFKIFGHPLLESNANCLIGVAVNIGQCGISLPNVGGNVSANSNVTLSGYVTLRYQRWSKELGGVPVNLKVVFSRS